MQRFGSQIAWIPPPPWLASLQYRVGSDIRNKKRCDLAMVGALLRFIARSLAPTGVVPESWDL